MTSTDTRPETEKHGFAFLRPTERPPKPHSGVVTEVGRIAATTGGAPVVAAVESATARATAEVAAQVARELKATLTFIHVRQRSSAIVGRVRSQRHLSGRSSALIARSTSPCPWQPLGRDGAGRGRRRRPSR